MHRVVVAGHGRKKLNVTLSDGFAVTGSLADFDSVDLTNLQRQIIHDTDTVGERRSIRLRTGCA